MRQIFESTGLFAGLPEWTLVGAASLSFGLSLFGGLALAALFFVWLERKVAGYIQSRYGPMYVGRYHGALQTIADALKLLRKEDIWPTEADKFLWRLAPILVFTGAFLSFVVLPFGPNWVGADMDIGLLYLFATSGLVVMGILAAGWGSNNKWSLYGAMRGAAQVVSYEIPLGLAVLPVVMATGSLNLIEIVERQGGGIWTWNVFGGLPLVGAITFVVYLISSLAEVNRTPFDLPETESELVSGYNTEYTGMKFAFFFLGEYAEMFVVSAIAVTVFLGGWYIGIPAVDAFMPAPLVFIVKSVFLVFVQIWLRWTLPRLRVDQLMHVCWKVLIPATLALLMIYGLARVIVG
ncbi:MAG TPA: NADH-quinone oxidoreductase subunit NuoH [Candidatus Krumholzibacteria bacterium]|nr:NADH-quinone oxidoreductase subunit NuoH [Candidatus Krumholzibacteria bacterium]